MRTKTTLCLMLIGGAVLVACGQKETAAPASAAVAAQVQSGTPATAAAALAPENALGKRTYGSVCSMCHAAGVAGAPKPGDKADWGPRVAQGKDTLYRHALEGFNGNTGAMPARGGSTLPDDAIKAAVDYMVARSQ
ncbi:cytochrome c5 family protein [Ralstonia pseudosolanacearum]|uniref:c-type cytochrome n=1 Tax=Ralstonia pseudosolanacearum TaxID=1310165 RepID=UPI0008D987EA|nr:c-type cytochrome [Ralstonia pseudosolanacearum]AZU59644.1 cytochrome c5 family protein [Ralstonia solanacearum]MCK4140243.1 cytochrome c5 family protein [Ralstonia pseudosolanacearum]OHU98732.1 cytochrome c5 family protein [Ralstonia solanacearum]QVX41689.1 cytochrome c5 family protein [Ralstonia solanacearum]RAA05423.1 cytochrome c5 family protein [Ralstonia pseudosolanacearum]